ncbi:hypothetical protein [Citrobacter amalonaticus]|uniref:hypothetical protein n=1 Tax=Citrobacter amalonaticus TaxID=35703 RepID=UPI00207D55F1|nr:hypothetical protein [Citrobacter amalonaticus]MCO4158243.1 hypothetical protein [Citrobacter amalonaticus]
MSLFGHMDRWAIVLFLMLGSFSAYAKLTSDEEEQIGTLVEQWNDVLNQTGSTQPQSLYAAKVEWYGQPLSAQQVIVNAQVFLAKNRDYQQHIVSTLNIQPMEDEVKTFAVNFVKRAGMTGKMRNYPEEMLLRRDVVGWRIISETDGITRANQSKEKSTEVARGKFDGQHLSYVWLREENSRTGGACSSDSDCDCALWSSDTEVKPVKLSQCLLGNVETLSGLDDSRRDRVMVSPEWWSSAFRVVHLFDIQKKQWIQVTPDFTRNLNMQGTETAQDLVKPDQEHPGKIRVTQAVYDDAKEMTTIDVISQPLWSLK